ncbi:MAG: ATP-binding protein [Acidibrevibacterium sp.]|jgi:SpoVK/Ycf46/Vps4 family AAA+-type ATPase|uniref:AAA family ATPase n=1 Tax=Acidibrevibacterium fodinaquatile TaxID=1969806 RepID=UPI0023A911C3|nr:ATP-binding protein [Acidibrevibacterium fodinaquatile]MCA7120918.1 ATP-binding protein [Acidibrevibacterium fodinaquatile]
MARSDLLISLVKAGSSGDSRSVRATAEALIAEEKAKSHNVLADRLAKALHVNGNGHRPNAPAILGAGAGRQREFLLELTPEKRIEDLVLSELNRRACEELIEEQQRASVLRAHSLEPRHRILLSGPPGNGKTSLAEAIAEALALPFFVVRYDAMIGSYLGETAARLRRVFDYVRTTPCVLFFDEFDAVGKERGDEHETGEIKRVVTSLLMQMDDLPSYTIVVAATNHSELLDRAVWRRFQLRLSLKAPTRAELTAYFQHFVDRMEEPLGRSPGMIAKALGAISYAEAEEFCLDVRRRHVLAMGETPLRKIVEERLKMWNAKTSPHDQEDASDDRLPASAGSEAGA